MKICECCGQKIVQYKHNINKTLISGLFKLYKYGQPSRLDKLKLTNTEHANFQKLRYFKLIVKTDDKHKWSITEFGKGFIEGVSNCPKFVFTENGRTINYSTELVLLADVKECAQYKIEWQEQASSQPKLF